MSQLPFDCLNEIFEYLEDDRDTLFSCLLVNRFWCKVSVRIFWRNIPNINTLINCLPNESKQNLYRSKVIISTLTSKLPIFNYATFCKVLSFNQVYDKLESILKLQFFKNNQYFLKNLINIVAQELFKMLMNKIPSLKKLVFLQFSNIHFTFCSEAKDCLKNLSELRCNSNVYPSFFYELSQICHNIQFFHIEFYFFETNIPNKLEELISVQENLKYLSIRYGRDEVLNRIIPLLKKPKNLTKLRLYGIRHYVSLSFITKFTNLTNLQELELSFNYDEDFVDFEKLQYVIFPRLRIFKIQRACSFLIKFLENNGNNLQEFCVSDNNNSLNLTIAKFCPNIRKLFTGFKNIELDTIKIVLNSLQYLESIKVWCGGEFLNEKEALEAFVKYSHKNTYEIILCHQYYTRSELPSKDLESFFVSWTNRELQKSLSLIIIKYDASSLDTDVENMEIIKKYIRLGVIKKFEVKAYDDEFV
ncbi:hypothetical protein C1645_837974 [Glomus cerebriforme]|uniref:F-box domain-containing protein n=1 Tax=Glomus cerebriforme TaxID=658196 RepID=A0A397S7S5_9GLOM|nr:hypothetical protein C1645_837974 [Glomus cerebriforme]